MEIQERYSGLVLHIVRGLVEHTDCLSVVLLTEGDSTQILVRVHPDDVGKIIGRGGQTVRAIRCILGSSAARDKLRIGLVINKADFT